MEEGSAAAIPPEAQEMSETQNAGVGEGRPKQTWEGGLAVCTGNDSYAGSNLIELLPLLFAQGRLIRSGFEILVYF